MPTLEALADALATGDLTSAGLVDVALERVAAPEGEGARAFISVNPAVRSEAAALDRRRAGGESLPRYAGIPIGVKDLFDVEGQVTRAGSRVLATSAPASRDASAVARLRKAGFLFIGRTNMTEFAYSGLGLNPHYGTPASIYDRATGRIPGGSTSGGAVAVAEGMAVASLGTDTGGSCRIPAAFNGIVGFKPTAHRVPRDGAIPLSTTLDSIGPLARSVQCCATLDAVLRDAPVLSVRKRPAAALRLLAPTNFVLDGMDEIVGSTFSRACDALRSAGVQIDHESLPELPDVAQLSAGGGIAAAECYRWHREMLAARADEYDPRVAMRIAKGRDLDDAQLDRLHAERRRLIGAMAQRTRGYDALLMPTTPIIAPAFAEFADDARYVQLNGLVLRNPSLANLLDGCSISLPCHRPADPPVGLMLIGGHDDDAALFEVAAEVERALVSVRAR